MSRDCKFFGKPEKTAMNRGILKQDDDFEEYSNIVVEHFSSKERIMDLKTVISIKIWAYKIWAGDPNDPNENGDKIVEHKMDWSLSKDPWLKELSEDDQTFYSQIWGRWFGKIEMGAGMQQRARNHSGSWFKVHEPWISSPQKWRFLEINDFSNLSIPRNYKNTYK